MVIIKNIVYLVVIIFAFSCSTEEPLVKNSKELVALLSVDSPKNDSSDKADINFNKISYIQKKDTYDSWNDVMKFNLLYGKEIYYIGGKVLYHEYGSLYELVKKKEVRYHVVDNNAYDTGKELFYHKGKIYFFKTVYIIHPIGRFEGFFFLAKYLVKNGKGYIKNIHDMKSYSFLNGEKLVLKRLKIHSLVNNKLYITAKLAKWVYKGKYRGWKYYKSIILLYDLKEKKMEIIGKYDFYPGFRISYAGKKVIVVYDKDCVYAIRLKDGSVIYKYKAKLLSKWEKGRYPLLYNYSVYFNKALYLIIPNRKEHSTKIIKIDETGETQIDYIPSNISLVAREKNKIYFIKMKFFTSENDFELNKNNYINYFKGGGANIVCLNLKTMKTEWQSFVSTKFGGGMGAPILTKNKVIACLGKKMVVINKATGKIQKIILLKGHFSARISCTENRITAFGEDEVLIIGECQRDPGHKFIRIEKYN